MELAEEVKELLEARSIEMGHARALLGLSAAGSRSKSRCWWQKRACPCAIPRPWSDGS
jgi:hypothetical protein